MKMIFHCIWYLRVKLENRITTYFKRSFLKYQKCSLKNKSNQKSAVDLNEFDQEKRKQVNYIIEIKQNYKISKFKF